ncbi:HAMP domain-containing histidine kinase [Paenibacillus sp. MER TA 81-3]|uniref:sensor histidine kinase n=1 Tax=Paenibacillus sp. MER TA 81-3 TaxID=2939573 RepID=UPI00203BCB9A|nr:ATP-binding protein [Paenibacillus sp. MER TA 81-3]MCM3340927.1 HAMP domain-containing histidine kinase [Paenibacillus sp. MER TA 81-3]
MLNKLSLRMRLTLLTGCIVILTAVCLTLTSIHNADSKFVRPNVQNAVTMNKMVPLNSSATLGHEAWTRPAANGEETSNISVEIRTIEAKEQFVDASVIYMMIIIILGMAAAYVISGRALKPVNQLSKTIKNINEHNLSHRIDHIQTKDEIGSLAGSFNTMLNRLDESFARQKRFAANAAHELKTPLTTIKAGIQVLKLDKSPSIEDYKENVDITELSTQRLIDVVDDLLKLTSEKKEKFADTIALSDTFQHIAQELEPMTRQKNIQIQVVECNHSIFGNQTLVYRALFNLLENAVKYNKHGGKVQIAVSLRGYNTIIHISDTGIGIPNEELPHIFEPFYRIDKSRSRDIGGSGLGLSIVKTIIEKHNGNIAVQSDPGVGTTFDVLFPSQHK